jgi:hypothetical protein
MLLWHSCTLDSNEERFATKKLAPPTRRCCVRLRSTVFVAILRASGAVYFVFLRTNKYKICSFFRTKCQYFKLKSLEKSAYVRGQLPPADFDFQGKKGSIYRHFTLKKLYTNLMCLSERDSSGTTCKRSAAGDGADSPTRAANAHKCAKRTQWKRSPAKRLAQKAFFSLWICFLVQKSCGFKFICILAR